MRGAAALPLEAVGVGSDVQFAWCKAANHSRSSFAVGDWTGACHSLQDWHVWYRLYLLATPCRFSDRLYVTCYVTCPFLNRLTDHESRNKANRASTFSPACVFVSSRLRLFLRQRLLLVTLVFDSVMVPLTIAVWHMRHVPAQPSASIPIHQI